MLFCMLMNPEHLCVLIFKVLLTLRCVYLGYKEINVLSHSRDKCLLLKLSLLFSVNRLPQILALLFLRPTWLKATDDDIRWSPSCMPWCHYSGGESFHSDMAACQEPSRFTLKEPAHWGHLKINVYQLPLLSKKQISLRDIQWLFTSLSSCSLSIPCPGFYFLPILPSLKAFLISNFLVPFFLFPPPYSANSCSPLLPQVPAAKSSLTCSQTPPSLCYRLEDEGSDRRRGQLEFVWHDSFPLCQRLVLPLW